MDSRAQYSRILTIESHTDRQNDYQSLTFQLESYFETGSDPLAISVINSIGRPNSSEKRSTRSSRRHWATSSVREQTVVSRTEAGKISPRTFRTFPEWSRSSASAIRS